MGLRCTYTPAAGAVASIQQPQWQRRTTPEGALAGIKRPREPPIHPQITPEPRYRDSKKVLLPHWLPGIQPHGNAAEGGGPSSRPPPPPSCDQRTPPSAQRDLIATTDSNHGCQLLTPLPSVQHFEASPPPPAVHPAPAPGRWRSQTSARSLSARQHCCRATPTTCCSRLCSWPTMPPDTPSPRSSNGSRWMRRGCRQLPCTGGGLCTPRGKHTGS